MTTPKESTADTRRLRVDQRATSFATLLALFLLASRAGLGIGDLLVLGGVWLIAYTLAGMFLFARAGSTS